MPEHDDVMNGRAGPAAWLVVALALAAPALSVAAPAVAEDAAARRGEYIFRASGCLGCHTDFKNKKPALAGGRAIETPFGTFYGPNITSDVIFGLGDWSEKDFIRALREGIAPDGSRYFPVFPYTSFNGMSDRDLGDLWAYIRTVPPIGLPNRAHEIDFPFGWRTLQRFWRWLYFTPRRFRPDPQQTKTWNRGAYLVRVLGHCGECHTERGLLGGLDQDQAMAGAQDGPEGSAAPNITPDRETGIGEWSEDDIVFLFKTGVTPEGDVVGALMAEVVEHGTRHLRDEDLNAMAEYLLSMPPKRKKIARKRGK